MNVRKVVLKKASFGYGFSLKDNGQPFSSSATVVRVEPGGAADLGGIRVGDRIRTINGRSLQSMTFLEASNAVRVSSQFIELELDESSNLLANQSDKLYPHNLSHATRRQNASEIYAETRSTLVSNTVTPATLSEHTVSSVRRNAEDELVNPDINTVAGAVITSAADAPPDHCEATHTAPSIGLISTLPSKNTSPERLSISVSAETPTVSVSYPSNTVATKAAAHTPLTESAPIQRRTRTPLATFNHSLDPYSAGSDPRVATQLIASTPSNSVQSSSKEPATPASSSVIFSGPNLSVDCSSQSDADTNNDSVHAVNQNRLSGVRTRNSDANVTKKAHRRQTFSRTCLDETEVNSGMPPVRFVRKRAYASARQAGRFDQFAAFSLSPEDTWTHHSPSSLASGNLEPNTSPCQLLPADPQSTPPPNIQVLEPKITHLPRRRSTKTHSDRPSIGLRRSRISGEYRRIEETASFPAVPSTANDSNVNEPVHDRRVVENRDQKTKVDFTSGRESVTQDIKLTQEPSEAPTLNLSQTQATNSSSVIESNPITSRIWASFDSDPDDSPFGWWSRAGETYQQLDLEYQRLMKRQSRLQQRQRRPDENEPENEFRHTSNKENKATGAVGSNGQETVGLAKSLTTRMNTSVSSHATWSSPINRRSDKSPAYSLGASHVDANESQLSEYSGIARRRQLRNLCAGLRYHRSESNIHHDVIGSFRSRQSLCKILTLDGSISKSFSWKPYYMCIAGSEVRFVKASSTFSNSNRKSKSAKQLADTALASRNMNSFDLIDDNRFWDGSLNSSRPGLNASDAHSGPVSVASSSYVILPLPGLIWTREEVPQDLPRWRPLAPTSTSGIVRKPSPVPDVMDPFHSGLSEPSDSVTVPAILHSTKSSNNEDSVLQSTIQCYRFAHIDAGVELLFVFPDKNTAMACLTMCEMSGGREASSLDIKMSSDRPQPECPLSISNAKAPILSHSESCDPTVELIKPEVSHSIASVVPTSWPALSGAQFKLTDRRQRRVDRQLIARPDPVTQIADAPAYAVTFSSLDVQTTTVVDMHSRLIGAAATSVGDSQTLPRSASVISNPDASAPVEDKSSQRSNKPRNAAPFLRGFKQWLNRPAYGTTDHQPTSLTQNTESNLESKMSALFADPPDLSDFECPGAVFGAPLENQVPSPDHMCVPVILHALVLGLETHGLQMTGLYRKPGRHRTIAQFVCVVNLVPDDIDLLLRLDAWHEPNALCGLVKHFLRRLPVGLFIPETWEPLASLVDSHHSINPPQLAYLLLSIRVKLRKLASEAFGIRNGHAIQGSMSSPDRSADSNTNFGLTGLSNSPKHGSPVSLRGASDCSSEGTRTVTSATWRWATLCFLIAHIREVVGYRHLNEVSFQCIAICFGPVFFGDSTNLARLNGVLENLFRHWPWLIQGLPLVTQKILESAAQNLETTPPDYTLSEAIEYLAQYESLSNTRVPSPVQFPTIDTDPNEPIMYSSDCSPMPASTDDRMNTRLSLEHSDRVFQAVRPLLNRALTSHTAVGKLGQRSSGTESTFSALQRATSAISSISTPRSANSSRRKTMDTHNIRTIQHVIPVEFRRPKPGRAGLNPKHLEPIRSDLQMGLAEQSHAQSDSSTGLQLTAGGVIPRPSVPTRNYRSNVSIGRSTKSPS